MDPRMKLLLTRTLIPRSWKACRKTILKSWLRTWGVELPRGAAKALIIDRLMAVAVQIPAENEEGAQ